MSPKLDFTDSSTYSTPGNVSSLLPNSRVEPTDSNGHMVDAGASTARPKGPEPLFAEDTGSLLAKYAKEPPSLELHVHPTHYRFSNQEGIIPRKSPVIQEFLAGVAEGVILPAATEVFRDSGVRFFEGCVILKIVDYQGVTKTSKELSETKHEMKTPSDPKPTDHSQAGQNETPSSDAGQPSASSRPHETDQPPSYRVLLRPTPLSLWHDLLYTTDASQGRFSDQLALSMESEILNLTTRQLDLRVPSKSSKKAARMDDRLRTLQSGGVTKAVHRVTYPLPVRKLHEDLPDQTSSAYDDFMLILDDQNALQASANVSNQFMRLAFIEQLKKKRMMRQGAGPQDLQNSPSAVAAAAAAAARRQNGPGLGPSLGQQGQQPQRIPSGPPNPNYPIIPAGSVLNQQQPVDMRTQNQMRGRLAQAQVQAQAQSRAQGQHLTSPPQHMNTRQVPVAGQSPLQPQGLGPQGRIPGRPSPSPMHMVNQGQASIMPNHGQPQLQQQRQLHPIGVPMNAQYAQNQMAYSRNMQRNQ